MITVVLRLYCMINLRLICYTEEGVFFVRNPTKIGDLDYGRTGFENENVNLKTEPREGWEQATEVARTARQHPDKRANMLQRKSALLSGWWLAQMRILIAEFLV